MSSSSRKPAQLDNFFMTSAMRLDRWRELNASAQTWAAECAQRQAPQRARRGGSGA